MKRIILSLIVVFISVQAIASEPSDKYTCYSDRKITDSMTSPWKDVGISVVFDYSNLNIVVYAKETLTLKIGKVGLHYYTSIGDNAVEQINYENNLKQRE